VRPQRGAEFARDEPGRGREDARIPKPEALRDPHGAEVGLVADEDVRPPLGTQHIHLVRPLPREPTGEAAELSLLPLPVDLAHRDPPRRPLRAGREEVELELRGDRGAASRQRDRMARRGSGPREG
jgi:hypothetical protein